MKRNFIVILLAAFSCVLSSCLHPYEVSDSSQSVAEDYISTHPKFEKRYGTDYTLNYVGGVSTGEATNEGFSGEEDCDYLVNGKDHFTVALKKEKKGNWNAIGVVCTSGKYVCNELNLTFEGSLTGDVPSYELDSLKPNGLLHFNGEDIEVIVELLSTKVVVYNAKMYREYKEKLTETEPNRLDLPEEQRVACTLLACSIIGDFDMFTAIPEDAYKDFSSAKEYHFHMVEDS